LTLAREEFESGEARYTKSTSDGFIGGIVSIEMGYNAAFFILEIGGDLTLA
jgi:hypothetical protein